jgi:hypothetical protein
MQSISIQNHKFHILKSLEKITIADSFVCQSNKTGHGNGEAKLYICNNEKEYVSFFGERGFILDGFITKENLLEYLEDVKGEYYEPSQDYRRKDSMNNLWVERRDKIYRDLDSIVEFQFSDQNQISGDRLYINSESKGYNLIREIALPGLSYLTILKVVSEKSNDLSFYFKLEQSENDSAFEKEIGNDDVIINSPFNPNKIKVRTSPSTIGQIIEDLTDGVINLNTEFQRHYNLWNDNKKSRFIESLLLRLPLPPFYFNEQEENDLEVIDGLQRINTIKSFVIEKKLILKDLEFLKEYDGCAFDDIPSILRRRIKTTSITTYIIEKGTPPEVKFNIFKRVNTGGLVLTPQEIRHAINQGRPAELVADLVRGEEILDEDGIVRTRKNHTGKIIKLIPTREGTEFLKATDHRIGSFRMEDRDFATRFVSFYLIPYLEYEPDLDTFLNVGMSRTKDLTENQIKILKDDFYNAMNLAYEIFQKDAFRKRFSNSDGRKPINKALFEVLSVCFAELTEKERARLKLNSNIFKNKLIELHNKSDGKFLRSITQGTAQKDMVEQRFNDIKRIITESLKYD